MCNTKVNIKTIVKMVLTEEGRKLVLKHLNNDAVNEGLPTQSEVDENVDMNFSTFLFIFGAERDTRVGFSKYILNGEFEIVNN